MSVGVAFSSLARIFAPGELRFLRIVEMGLAITAPIWAYVLLFPPEESYVRGLILAPALIGVNLLLGQHLAKRDPVLQRVMPIAYLAKLAAGGIYIFVVLQVFKAGDVLYYHESGTRFAATFLATHEWWRSGTGINTDFILSAVAALYTVAGSSFSFGLVFFATLAFWGEFLIYRACCIGVKSVNRGRAALLLFLFPSIVFWSATIGKEALMYFATGLVIYGAVRLSRAPSPLAYVSLVSGSVLAVLVRPHVAALMAVSITATYFFTRNANGTLGVVIKILSLPLLAYGCFYSFSGAEQFLKADTLSTGIQAVHRVGHNSAYGGSMTPADESLPSRLLKSPFILCRPFPWEVRNPQSAFACLEGMLLFYFLWSWRFDFVDGLKRWRQDSSIMFSIVYCVLYSVMLSSAISNIGIIARQRILMAPFALLLFCTKREHGHEGSPNLKRAPAWTGNWSPVPARPRMQN